MTKPARSDWHRAWELDVDAGRARHGPTGLAVFFDPQPPGGWPAGRQQRLEAAGLAPIAEAVLPSTVVDRRPAHQIAPGSLNPAGVMRWAVVVALRGPESLDSAREQLEARMGPADAQAALLRLAREAAQLWAFRARLDRERPRASI